METGRDRILKAMRHVQPDTTPVNVGGIYDLERWLKYFEVCSERELRAKLDLDIEYARPVYTGAIAQAGFGIFGTPVEGVYGADGVGYAESRGGCPLAYATSTAEVEEFRWPDPADFDYDVVRATLEKIPAEKARRVDIKYGLLREGKSREECATSGPWIPLICTLFDLFGFENTLTKICLEPKLIEAAVAKIEEFLLEFARRLLQASKGLADALYFGDDFSTQRGMMISPEHWRKFLKPTYRRVFDVANRYGVKVWFHSCGAFRPVLPDLIDCGMDVWETVQVHLNGNEPSALKRDFGSALTFYGAISTQQTLPRGTTDDVRAEVRERIRVLGAGGGYICGSDHGILPDVPIENVLAMLDEARQFRF
jgi:uroporphyrinogen decarboxylase